jgi:ABC-type multidrug transport system permease subunit
MRSSAILWKEWKVFANRWASTTLGAIIGPVLYLVAFGWGIGDSLTVDGVGYTAFVLPGIVALNSMTTSYGWVANDINLSRIYAKTFEAVMVAPLRMSSYTLCRIAASALRGLYSAALIILIAWASGVRLDLGWYFWLTLALNCMVFASIGMIVGCKVDSHADMARISNFVITPMSFLCGTFFPLDRLPAVLRLLFGILPLTQAVEGLRTGLAAPGGLMPAVTLTAWLAVLIPLAVAVCNRTE